MAHGLHRLPSCIRPSCQTRSTSSRLTSQTRSLPRSRRPSWVSANRSPVRRCWRASSWWPRPAPRADGHRHSNAHRSYLPGRGKLRGVCRKDWSSSDGQSNRSAASRTSRSRGSARGTWSDAPHDDTITGQEMHALPRGVPHRISTQAFQAECRGFETRLPLQSSFRSWRDTQPVPLGCVEGCRDPATTLSCLRCGSHLATMGRGPGSMDAEVEAWQPSQ